MEFTLLKLKMEIIVLNFQIFQMDISELMKTKEVMMQKIQMLMEILQFKISKLVGLMI
jgi:hypothetical protein